MQVYGIFTVASLWTYQEINHAFGQVILIVIKYNAHTHTHTIHTRTLTYSRSGFVEFRWELPSKGPSGWWCSRESAWAFLWFNTPRCLHTPPLYVVKISERCRLLRPRWGKWGKGFGGHAPFADTHRTSSNTWNTWNTETQVLSFLLKPLINPFRAYRESLV